MLGAHCSYQISKPENDLFGRFGNGAVGSLLVQVDEVKSLHDYADNIKDLITNATLNSEKKGRDTIVVANLAILFSPPTTPTRLQCHQMIGVLHSSISALFTGGMQNTLWSWDPI